MKECEILCERAPGLNDGQLHAESWPIYVSLMFGGIVGLLVGTPGKTAVYFMLCCSSQGLCFMSAMDQVGNRLAPKVDAAAFQRWLLLFLLAGAFLMLSSVRPGTKCLRIYKLLATTFFPFSLNPWQLNPGPKLPLCRNAVLSTGAAFLVFLAAVLVLAVPSLTSRRVSHLGAGPSIGLRSNICGSLFPL